MKVKDKILREVVQEIISEKKKKGDCILARDYAISKVLMTEVFAELSKRGIIKMGVGNTYVLTEYCVELSRQYCYDMIVSDMPTSQNGQKYQDYQAILSFRLWKMN